MSMWTLMIGLPLVGLLIIVQRYIERTQPKSPLSPARYTNPFRIGGYCTIIEDPTRPDMNWNGTVLATRGLYMTVRDNETGNTVDLEKAFVFPYGTVL